MTNHDMDVWPARYVMGLLARLDGVYTVELGLTYAHMGYVDARIIIRASTPVRWAPIKRILTDYEIQWRTVYNDLRSYGRRFKITHVHAHQP